MAVLQHQKIAQVALILKSVSTRSELRISMANLNDTNSIQSIPVTLCLRWNLTWIALGIVVVVSLFPCDANANANSSKHRGADAGRESAANVEAKFDENDPLREDQQGDSEEIWLVSSRHVKCPSLSLIHI